MNTLTRWILPALLLAAPGALCAERAFAQEAGDAARPAEKPAEPSVEQILERLGKVEKELLQLRIKSGAVPADKNEQRILTLIETPYLGNLQYGSAMNQRFVALKLMLVNLTDQPTTLVRDDVQLTVDGQAYPIKEPARDFQYRGLQIGQQQLQIRSLQTAKEISVNPGATSSTWMLFPELPAGNHVPPLVLRLKLGDKWRQVDLNAVQRDALGMKIERIGPRGSLGLISIAGALDTINVGTLVEEIDRLAGDRIVRVVVSWKDGGSIADPQLASWLHSAVASQGRGGQVNDALFPALPASLREMHLAALPEVGNARGIQQMYPSFSFPNPGAAVRQHKTEAEAVVAALRTAYESLPREELLQAIQSGSRLERAAALVGGGGRLEADKLPVLLKLADDDDLLIQQAALLALSHFGEPAAIEKLTAAARKDVAGLSTTAISGLAGSRYPAAHQALLELLHNEPPESKKNIVRLLAAFPRPIWSDAIYEFVKDGRSGLNVEALQALVQVGHPKLLTVLEEALRGGDQGLSQAALGVLATRSDRESEEVSLGYTLEKLKTAPASPVMLTLLGRVKDKRAVPLLMAQFGKHENKSAVIQTLALLGDGETAKFLIEKYPQVQNHEKGEIIRAVSQLDKEAFRRLAAQALTTTDGSVISQAVRGLQEDGGPEAVRIMAEALESTPSNQSWAHLCNALAQAATPAARAALLKARDSENREKRSYALNGLQQLRQRSPGHQYLSEASSLSQRQKWKEAIEQYGLAIQLDPTLPDAWTERGHAYLHLDKPQEAARDFEKGLELDPYNSVAVTGSCLAMVMADGKHVEAVKRLEEARARFPRDFNFAYNGACVYGRSYERLEKDVQSAERDKLLEHYKQSAFSDLKTSLQWGFQDFELMKTDPDLAPFRETPEFKQLITAPPTPEGNGRGARRGGNIRP